MSDFPYNLGFMGRKWDTISNYYDWCLQRAKGLYRVMKYGGYCLIFGGTRTHHRLVCAFEDAGFEIKDEIQWIYGSGFPKSYNISKGFDKQNKQDLSDKWDGFGTALKPAQEPIMVAQKPIEKNYCYNIEKYGVGGINIDGCRVGNEIIKINQVDLTNAHGNNLGSGVKQPFTGVVKEVQGRFPANIIFDEEAAQLLDQQTGILKSGTFKPEGFKGEYSANIYGRYANNQIDPNTVYGDSGGASRFFYCAKASTKDRNENGLVENNHPTVKPTPLIKYLVKLVTPQTGICLDICEGSGTHGKACVQLTNDGYPVNYIGFENDEESFQMSLKRIELNQTNKL